MVEVKEMVIPLRAAWRVPRTKRANRAMAEVRKHVAKHMKLQDGEEMYIDSEVNEAIWARGMQKPPRKIRVVCTRDEGFPLEVKLAED
ncbi:MAG: 50S ribosomal protein L31e [Candidatus Thalassarchaeaceae archaeon]|jgi:large subunit ribosomal protein L31e|nr:50S ribosomal protein L31e [Candidatus Thalassarchaeaceae archaeon]|tara:strand:- start:340 stop:603 length:264 start_codon:yes stop_codon:yes gene_type:complete